MRSNSSSNCLVVYQFDSNPRMDRSSAKYAKACKGNIRALKLLGASPAHLYPNRNIRSPPCGIPTYRFLDGRCRKAAFATLAVKKLFGLIEKIENESLPNVLHYDLLRETSPNRHSFNHPPGYITIRADLVKVQSWCGLLTIFLPFALMARSSLIAANSKRKRMSDLAFAETP